MKKIVAIVLSLVMVLGLATTAFAATTSTGSVATTSVTPVKAAGYQLAAAGGSMTELDVTITTIEKTTVTGKVTADVPMYVPTIWALNGDFFVEVAKADATYALKNNGAYVYLFPATAATVDGVIAEFATAVVMDSIVLPADEDVDCGDAYVTVGQDKVCVPYYVSGDDVYSVGGTTFAYFNGEFVAYGAAPSFKYHSWDAKSLIVKATDVKGVQVPVSIECEDCEKTFPIVGIAKFDNTWELYVDYDVYTAGKYFIVLDAVAADAPAASDKVESAQTFDAGIAMYVGMSVMAAAGSAVVLKKKD
ncbi:MAG: hypothetical protein IKV99_00300 [Oscillospiraceae bacterium]|nr:hypothetical protein [Oscillospiraceae bacterium]